MASIKDLEGSVPVNGDITPITRQPITQVNAAKWSEMSLTDLHEQKNVLETRLHQALQCDHPEMALQIRRGLETITQLICVKAKDNVGLIR